MTNNQETQLAMSQEMQLYPTLYGVVELRRYEIMKCILPPFTDPQCWIKPYKCHIPWNTKGEFLTTYWPLSKTNEDITKKAA